MSTDKHPGHLRVIPEDWLYPLQLDCYFKQNLPLELDVGCGKGRFLLARAASHPNTNFLGIDRKLRRIRKIDRKGQRKGLNNLRLLRLDACYAVAHLIPADSVSAMYVFFPDPWPKGRHQRNRLFGPEFLNAASRVLKTDGVLHFATDHLPYFEQVRALMVEDARFEETAPFVPEPSEQTDFELRFIETKPIGRASFIYQC